MAWSFSLGRILGSEIRVHVTFLILLGWIAVSVYQTQGIPAAIWNTLFIIALFACVLAHEFGHALMARRYGIRTPTVTLLPIGGLAQLDRMPERPAAEIAVALAGPAVSLLLGLVFAVAVGASISADGLVGLQADMSARAFVAQLAIINIYLAVFNLLPAFPMDGGRVLRALLTLGMGRVRGTQTAASVGKAMAIAFGLFGLYSGNTILVLVAAFVFFAATSESADATMREVTSRHRARDAMITEFHPLGPADSLAVASDAVIRTTQHEFPVIDGQGRPMGFLTRTAIFSALAKGDTQSLAGDLMSPTPPLVAPEAPLSDILDLMAKDPSGAVLIVGKDGRLIGYITRENLGELLVVAQRPRAA